MGKPSFGDSRAAGFEPSMQPLFTECEWSHLSEAPIVTNGEPDHDEGQLVIVTPRVVIGSYRHR